MPEPRTRQRKAGRGTRRSSNGRASFAERTARFELPGGAMLQVLETPGTGTVVLRGSLRAGAALDPEQRPGLAELTARALDTGTRKRNRLEIAEALDARGVSVRFVAGVLTTGFGARCIAEDFDLLSGAIVEMLREPAFPEEEIETLKQRTVGQLRQSADSTSVMSMERFYQAIYPKGHPLWTPSIPDRIAGVEACSAQEMRRFHAETFGPAQLCVTVVGDLAAERVHQHLSGLLSGWSGPSRSTEPWVDPDRPARSAGKRITVSMPGKSNIDVLWGHTARLTKKSPDYYAAILGNSALGGSTLSSRLGVRVRDQEGLTYGIYSRFLGASLITGPWLVSVTVAPENLEQALRSAGEVVRTTLKKGVSAEELQEEQEQMAGGFVVGLATNDGIAHELHDAAFYGRDPSWLDQLADRIRAVTQREANRALRKHVRPDDAVTIACGPV